MPKRILIHDYAGHPFQVQLSRNLAQNGHQVLHLYAGYNITPRGELQKKPADPEGFDVRPIFIREPLQKYSFVKRWFQEREYGKLLVDEITSFQPEIFISSNTPLDAQVFAQRATRSASIPFIFWLQDINGIAARKLLRERIPILGELIGIYYENLERRLLRRSDHIVLITADFDPIMRSWGIPDERTSVIPNWAPLADLPPRPKSNPWSAAQKLDDKFCFMYTGTLGMKHNPGLLVDLARTYTGADHVRVVVISEGPGADWLREQKNLHNLENLILLPYQPFEDLPQVMGTADVLIALLEPDAGIFSVPSKVLSYLCSQRPLLLAVPEDNLAAKIVANNQAGFVVPPGVKDAFLDRAAEYFRDPELRERFARNGRDYAEATFLIERIGSRFRSIFNTL